MKRLRIWRTLGLTILITPVIALVAIGVTEALDLSKWFLSIHGTLGFFLFFYVLPRLLRKGWFPWLLHQEQPTANKN